MSPSDPGVSGGPDELDSAGVPWQGRTLPDPGFAADTGAADPALIEAATTGDDRALVEALAAARLLVPVAAVETERATGHGGLHADAATDMAVLLITHPDGRRALPVFSSLAAMADYDPALRPVPVTAARAAQAAITEGAGQLVLDCASTSAREVRPSMLWALAQQRSWIPPHLDPFVREGIARVLAQQPAVRGHQVDEGQPAGEGTVRITLDLVPGLAAEQVRSLVTTLAEQLAADGELRARVDSLAFALT